MIAGLYLPGDGWIHGLSAPVKLGFMFFTGLTIVVISHVSVMVLLTISVGFIFSVVAGLGFKRLWLSTRPLLIWVLAILLAQLWLVSAEAAVLISLRLVTLVWVATLVTYTTRLSEMSDVLAAMCSVLRPLGVNPERIAFLIALTIRLIPSVFDIVRDVRDVQKARGLERSYAAMFVPVLTRLLREADALSDALVARGFERWGDQR